MLPFVNELCSLVIFIFFYNYNTCSSPSSSTIHTQPTSHIHPHSYSDYSLPSSPPTDHLHIKRPPVLCLHASISSIAHHTNNPSCRHEPRETEGGGANCSFQNILYAFWWSEFLYVRIFQIICQDVHGVGD